MAITIINPAAIATGDAQVVTVDVTKFDFAKQQVTLVVDALKPLFTITSDEQMDEAMQVLKQAKEIDKALEEKRKQLVKPFNDGANRINDYKKELITNLVSGIDKVKTAVLGWQREKEKKAKEARVVVRQGQLTVLGFIPDSNGRYTRENIGSVSQMEMENYEDRNWNEMINGYTEMINRLSQQQVQKLEAEKEIVDMFGSEDDKKELDQKIQTASIPVAKPVTTYNGSAGAGKLKGSTKTWTFEIEDASQIPREYLMVDETAIRKAINAGIRELPGVKIFQKEGLSIR